MYESCDTFVVLPPLTKNGAVVFGKNSDRPNDEIQEVIYVKASEAPGANGRVKCTYIEIDIDPPTRSVILSKPNWMWGCEMGANDKGVVVGNEAVWTDDNDGDADPSIKRLLGMDLIRLALERANSSDEALEILTKLLVKYGQGGPCSEDGSMHYHNSFLIADSRSAWVLETVGKHWAAEHVTSGYRNISNELSITTKIDKMSNGLVEHAKAKKLWNGEGNFNFAKAFGGSEEPKSTRYIAGRNLLENMSSEKDFKETDMFNVLRNKASGICRSSDDASATQGSQVSVLNSKTLNVHWFTATPDPSMSVFKPFVFTDGAVISKHIFCPEEDRKQPHTLYSLHAAAKAKNFDQILALLKEMEQNCVEELSALLQTSESSGKLEELDELFKDCVETEVKFYR